MEIETTATLHRQIKNCEDMLLIMPDSGPDPEWFDIKTFDSFCGSFRCWLGDYYKRKGLLQKFCSDIPDTHRHVRWAFGGDIYDIVFSDCIASSTQQRKTALQSHLQTLKERLVRRHTMYETPTKQA